MRPAVFLDRDGVLNEVVVRDGAVASPRARSEFRLAPGAALAVARLRGAGLPVFVVTNQPDLARGLLPPAEHEAMLAQLRTETGVDDASVCPHDDAAQCRCRKPLPGMLIDLAERRDIDLARSYLVGDTWRDMAAGRAAGCTTVLVRTWYNDDTSGDVEAATLADATDWILRQHALRTAQPRTRASA